MKDLPIKLGYRKIIAGALAGAATYFLTHKLGIDLGQEPLKTVGLDGLFPGQTWAKLIPEGATLAAFYITTELKFLDESDATVPPPEGELDDPPVEEGEQGV